MEAKRQLKIVLQTGPFTSPEPLLRGLETLDRTSIDVRRLATSFRAGGSAAFIGLLTPTTNVEALAEILHRHTTRLDQRGIDNLFLLIGARITTEEKEIGFGDIRSQKQVSLKGKSQSEIREILENIPDEGVEE